MEQKICIQTTIDTLTLASNALKVFVYDHKLNTFLSSKDPQSLKQANTAIDKIDKVLVKIRLSLVWEHKGIQERLIQSIRATTLFYWHQVSSIRSTCKDKGFFSVVKYIDQIEKSGIKKIDVDKLESLILAETAPFQE